MQTVFGHSLFVQKITAAIPSGLLLLIGGKKVKDLYGEKAALLFTFMLLSFPQLYEYSIQPRMYTWAMLFVTLCGIYGIVFYQTGSGKSQWIMIAMGVCAAYTHYYAALAVALCYLILLGMMIVAKREYIKKWILMVLVSAVGYLPWLFVLLYQVKRVQGGDFALKEVLRAPTLLECIQWIFDTDTPYGYWLFIGIFLCVLFLLVRKIRAEKQIEDQFALFYFFIPIVISVIGIVCIHMGKAVFTFRYLYPSIGLVVLMLAVTLRDADKKIVVLLCVFAVLVNCKQYGLNWDKEYRESKLSQTEAFFQENLGENDVIMYNFQEYAFIYEMYWPAEQLCYVEDMDYEKDYDQIWYLDSFNRTYVPDEVFQEHHLQKEYIGEYGLEDNEFTIYRLTRDQVAYE